MELRHKYLRVKEHKSLKLLLKILQDGWLAGCRDTAPACHFFTHPLCQGSSPVLSLQSDVCIRLLRSQRALIPGDSGSHPASAQYRCTGRESERDENE